MPKKKEEKFELDLKPRGKYVIVEIEDQATQTKSGIYLEHSDKSKLKGKSQKGKVLAIGPEVEFAKIGDIVVFPYYAPEAMEFDGKKIHFVHELSIVAKA